MFHRSERLFLRPAWPEDWEAIFQGIADEGVVRNLATAPWPYTEEDAHYFAQLPHDPQSPRFLITLAATGELVGCIGLDRHNDKRGDMLEMGYWIGRKHWGQGYATEAGKAAIRIARSMGHERVVASHYLDNPASGRVLRKVGFVPTGKTEKVDCLARQRPVEATGYEYDLAAENILPLRAA